MEKENLSIRIRLEAFLTEREAMVAANQQRISQGEAVAYGFSHFEALASQIAELEEEMKEDMKSIDENQKELLNVIRQLKEENENLKSANAYFKAVIETRIKKLEEVIKCVKKQP